MKIHLTGAKVFHADELTDVISRSFANASKVTNSS